MSMSKKQERKMDVEILVAKYGSKYRKLITSALDWLVTEEPKWGLDKPINKEEYIESLIEKVSKT
jgi:hypothetical protein